MRIIVDGPDGSGKSTLVKQLADHYGCDIIHMTEKGSKRFEDYCDKSNLDNIISDRSFLSEIAYSGVFERQCRLTLTECEQLIEQYRKLGWHFLILDADTDIIKNRLRIRGDESEHKINKISELRMMYRGFAYFYGLNLVNTEDVELKDIIKILEDKKHG